MSTDILQELAARAAARVENDLKRISRAEILSLAEAHHKADLEAGIADFRFEAALRGPGLHFICECKRASPSRGLIAPDYDPVAVAQSYERGGAHAVSVLTEPTAFLGSDADLERVAAAVSLPVLRKDFTVDEVMIDQAKCLGACAVLLIVSLLEEGRLKDFLARAHSLGLSVLVEAHTPDEIELAKRCGAGIIGVNNRNLRTFDVDVSRAERMRALVGEGHLYVSESGIRSVEDCVAQFRAGANAVLVGETLMRESDREGLLARMREATR